jgi:AraC-like DNA-binding protein
MQNSGCVTGDTDAARAFLGEHFYSTFLDVLRPQPGWQARLDVTSTGPITLGDLQFGADVRARFGELGAYHVDVPLSGALTWRQGGSPLRHASTSSAAVFQPVGDTVLERWDADSRLLAVKVDRVALEARLGELIDAPVSTPVRLGPALDLTRGPGAGWLRLLRLAVVDATEPDGLFRHPVIGAQLQESLLTGLLLATDHPYRDRLDNPPAVLAAPRAIRRVVEAMRAQPGRSFTLRSLADIAGVSPRSLQQTFQRYVGVAPMAYLRQVRLAAVHEQLRETDPAQETVTEIAQRYGFTHGGRFAAAYRTRYGVRPSDTLRE